MFKSIIFWIVFVGMLVGGIVAGVPGGAFGVAGLWAIAGSFINRRKDGALDGRRKYKNSFSWIRLFVGLACIVGAIISLA